MALMQAVKQKYESQSKALANIDEKITEAHDNLVQACAQAQPRYVISGYREEVEYWKAVRETVEQNPRENRIL